MRMMRSHDIVKERERESFLDHIQLPRPQITAIIISSVRLSLTN